MQQHNHTVYFKWLIIRCFFFCLLLIFTSCRTSRKTTGTTLPGASSYLLIEKMKENGLMFETLAAKFSADYRDGANQTSFSGTLRIKKDSILWLSLSPVLGIELMRVVITRDSVKILDRMKATGIVRDFHYLDRWVDYPPDFSMIQEMITGNGFTFADPILTIAAVDGNQYRLEVHKQPQTGEPSDEHEPGGMTSFCQIWLNPENFKVVRTLVQETQGANRTVETTYRDFKMAGEQTFPYEITCTVQDGGRRLELSLHYFRLKLNETLSFPFTIPKDYSRLDSEH